MTAALPEEPTVAIIGAGPAGAAAASALTAAGVRNVAVIEREPVPGGIPRFCDHPTFGLREFGRLLSGPTYAKRLLPLFEGSILACRTTVEGIGPDLSLALSTPDGFRTIRPSLLLLATGIRETPRAPRLVSGDRPDGVLTTGALQRMLHESYRPPIRTAVVIGSELVSFSALLTLRSLGIRPLAMLEERDRITARRPGDLVARLLLGVPVHTSTRLISINAHPDIPRQLASVTVEGPTGRREIECDAIVFTGAFVPDASLLGPWAEQLVDARTSGPAVDQHWRTRDARIFAAGNFLRGVETAGWAFAEGRAAGRAIAASLAGNRPHDDRAIEIALHGPLRYVVPSFISPGLESANAVLQLRVERRCSGHLELKVDGKTMSRSRSGTYLPERRLLMRPGPAFYGSRDAIEISFVEDGK